MSNSKNENQFQGFSLIVSAVLFFVSMWGIAISEKFFKVSLFIGTLQFTIVVAVFTIKRLIKSIGWNSIYSQWEKQVDEYKSNKKYFRMSAWFMGVPAIGYAIIMLILIFGAWFLDIINIV